MKFIFSEIDATEEAIPNCDDIPENRFKIYVKHSWLIFAETAESIISSALDANNASTKNSNKLSTGLEPVSIVVGGILTACGFIGNIFSISLNLDFYDFLKMDLQFRYQNPKFES